MGRRLIRIRQPLGPESVAAPPDTLLDVMLTNGMTVHGRLVRATAAALVVADVSQMWPRRAFHEQVLPWADIREVTLAPYKAF